MREEIPIASIPNCQILLAFLNLALDVDFLPGTYEVFISVNYIAISNLVVLPIPTSIVR